MTFYKIPGYLKILLKPLEKSNGSLFKAASSLFNFSIYSNLLKLAQVSDALLCYEITYRFL